MTKTAAASTTLVEGSPAPLLWLYPACGLLVFSGYAAFTVISIVSMGYCDKETAATDFSLLTVLPYLGAMPFAILSGWITQAIGYRPFFALSALLSIASLMLIFWLYRGQNDINSQSHSAHPNQPASH